MNYNNLSVLYLDEQGNFVLREELLPDGWGILIHTKISDYSQPILSDDDLDKLLTHDYVISSVDRSYIGRLEDYMEFRKKYGMIFFQKSSKTAKSASIGYSLKHNRWYGWSHRAIYGFTIGDVVKEGDLTNYSGLIKEYEIQHPEENKSLPIGFKAKTLYDAKRMAIAYARAVS